MFSRRNPLVSCRGNHLAVGGTAHLSLTGWLLTSISPVSGSVLHLYLHSWSRAFLSSACKLIYRKYLARSSKLRSFLPSTRSGTTPSWFSVFQKFTKIFHVLYHYLWPCEINFFFTILLMGFRREFKLRDDLPCLTRTPISTFQNAPSWKPRTLLQSCWLERGGSWRGNESLVISNQLSAGSSVLYPEFQARCLWTKSSARKSFFGDCKCRSNL